MPPCCRVVGQPRYLFENFQFFQPSYERMRCSVGLFLTVRVLHFVEDFIALVDSRSSLRTKRLLYGV